MKWICDQFVFKQKWSQNITYGLIHQLMCHPVKNNTFKSSNVIGETIYNRPSSILTCEDYELENIWHQYILKSTSNTSTNKGERIYIDTFWVNFNIYGSNKYFLFVVDEVSGIIFSIYFNE